MNLETRLYAGVCTIKGLLGLTLMAVSADTMIQIAGGGHILFAFVLWLLRRRAHA